MKIKWGNASLTLVILTLTAASTQQTINARFSHYHSLHNENDSKSVLAPGFSMPPGIPDCADSSPCSSPPPGARQNASSATPQGFLSSLLGKRALVFLRSPTFSRNSLTEKLLSWTRTLLASQRCMLRLYTILAC